MVWIKADVDDDTHRAIKIAAAESDRSMYEVAAEALEQQFEKRTQTDA